MSEQTEKATEREGRWAEFGWRFLVWLIVAILLLVLLAENAGPVRVLFFFLVWRMSLALWSLLCIIAGVVMAMLIFWARRRG
jgi:uncharacterized integral membrane protein